MINRKVSGFTLIEVLVALAIVAVVSVAMYNTRIGHLTNLQRVQDKTFAHWVALNKMTEFYYFETFPSPGLKKYDATLADREWQIEATVTETENQRLRRVEINVGLLPESGQPFQSVSTILGLVAQRE
ncbi:MAG: type II secretion system protein GspI [Gammaproteobacteria bacterium]|nr:MAG: type II secretion system protein GspI [Gammaproteobacteria bacterium]